MYHALSYFYWLCIFGAVGTVLLAPLYLWGTESKGSTQRRVAARIAGSVLIAVMLGAYGYSVLPADYTRDQRFSWPPVSSSLAEIHLDYEERLNNPEAISPDNVTPIREIIRKERLAYVHLWLPVLGIVVGVAIAAPTAADLFRRRGRHRAAWPSGTRRYD